MNDTYNLYKQLVNPRIPDHQRAEGGCVAKAGLAVRRAWRATVAADARAYHPHSRNRNPIEREPKP